MQLISLRLESSAHDYLPFRPLISYCHYFGSNLLDGNRETLFQPLDFSVLVVE